MKKIMVISAIVVTTVLIIIAMLQLTPSTTSQIPVDYIEYDTYELNGKETAELILKVLYQDVSPDYKGGFNNDFEEEWQIDALCLEIDNTVAAIEIMEIDDDFDTIIDDIDTIRDHVDDWIEVDWASLPEGKDYRDWLDKAMVVLESPGDTHTTVVSPCQNIWCHGTVDCFIVN